jgi:hypothetical protein
MFSNLKIPELSSISVTHSYNTTAMQTKNKTEQKTTKKRGIDI